MLKIRNKNPTPQLKTFEFGGDTTSIDSGDIKQRNLGKLLSCSNINQEIRTQPKG